MPIPASIQAAKLAAYSALDLRLSLAIVAVDEAIGHLDAIQIGACPLQLGIQLSQQAIQRAEAYIS